MFISLSLFLAFSPPPTTPPNVLFIATPTRLMDVYALTKKQRPTHLTRGEPNKTDSAMVPTEQPSQLLPPQQQQRQQHAVIGAPPTLQDIESRYSQLPPQYRQAVLEQQQKAHQQRLLQYQQSQQQGGSLKSDPARQPSSGSPSPNGMTNGNNGGNGLHKESPHSNSTHQVPSTMSSFRSDRNSVTPTTNTSSGPSRAHWKVQKRRGIDSYCFLPLLLHCCQLLVQCSVMGIVLV